MRFPWCLNKLMHLHKYVKYCALAGTTIVIQNNQQVVVLVGPHFLQGRSSCKKVIFARANILATASYTTVVFSHCIGIP